jgi:hypothetical protein
VPSNSDLDSFGEVYPGFDRDRRLVKSRIADADRLWRAAFERIQRTPEFYQARDEDVARETMRTILEFLT